MKHYRLPLPAALFTLLACAATADAPVIEEIRAQQSSNGWRFDVTLSHGDTGWDHYADGWRIEDAEGTILGTRELLHPHETEQPFTRSLSGVRIPDTLTSVEIRARDNTEGWAERTKTLELRR